jgi:glycosyltransferase involved in cell wall biosynthesis
MDGTRLMRELAQHVTSTVSNVRAAYAYRQKLASGWLPPAQDTWGREIALLVSTYQRPGHLRRCLASIALQQGVQGKMEVVVTDDGSEDETPYLVQKFASTVDFPVHFTTHPHQAFQLARCRNEGARASTAPYLLFLDGDCVLPPDHVATHLEFRKPGVVAAGDCSRLDEGVSEALTMQAVRTGVFREWSNKSELKRLAQRHHRVGLYNLLRHPTKPMLVGNNVGVWRADYEMVNGYDENFQGWGCEDDDLGYRLRAAGLRIQSILNKTYTYHIWHPTDATFPSTWREGANVSYLKRANRAIRCEKGLVGGEVTVTAPALRRAA